ncbi:zinc-dependent metalloprotease [Ichthyenterobacterium sp. W332]|uniref:Zinc-dependent metalloprotease n=1 Tax=Microcosmobacter mediterraneus TaxID=3075607 RepID=A0ABU2YKV9_9FLAO|nr:zinc-dependent metalloprotease [Ichthyenterobacterium sp. W332]MDT0558802.1 zinc-dependent metalloprotease [Ichthyenterobacterium sp. W332]
MRFKLIVILVLSLSFSSFGQMLKDKKLQDFKGFFDFHYEESTDKIYLKVKALDEEFLYVSSLSSGIGSNDIGLDRGQLGNERLVKFQKAGNKLMLIQPNLQYRANTDNALERESIEQAFAKSVLFGFPILESDNGEFIIDFTPFLMQDTHGVVQTLKRSKEGNYKLDKSKSALNLKRTKAFPKNVEFNALLTFAGQPTGRNIRSVTPTASLVSVTQHHSFIKLPDRNYKPRVFDVRSGAISTTYMDYATPVQEPILKRFIIRHRLEKINPNASISEAKEPIVYYLDSGTPEPIRSALLDGARWWNQAYEAIGFKDAFQVKILPADADPMDCRYNVIQWVHRSTRGWSYGASVVDPRTGEIIKGHVSLGSLRIRQDFMIAQALLNKPFAERDDNYQPMLEMALARIRQLSAHEVGHTLGFAHNFAASTNGRASVMDYPHPLIKLTNGEIDLSDAYDTKIGDWDKITVAYSYSDFPTNTDEKLALNSILQNAYSDGLRFITDSDARAKGGAHALAHLWDNGQSASEELNRYLEVRQQAITNFSKDNIRSGEPYSVLEDVFVPLYFSHRYQTEAAVKLVGGLDYNYAVKNDNQFTVKSISKEEQRIALESVLSTVSAKTLSIPKDKLSLFPPRAYGYWRGRESFSSKSGVSFDALSAASTASDMTLGLLLHPERMNRLIQQKGLDNLQLGVDDVFNALINTTFKQIEYDTYESEVHQLISFNALKHLMNLAISDRVHFQVNAYAQKAIEDILRVLDNTVYGKQFKRIIADFYENPDDFKLINSPKIPDGSPIGSDLCSFTTN